MKDTNGAIYVGRERCPFIYAGALKIKMDKVPTTTGPLKVVRIDAPNLTMDVMFRGGAHIKG